MARWDGTGEGDMDWRRNSAYLEEVEISNADALERMYTAILGRAGTREAHPGAFYLSLFNRGVHESGNQDDYVQFPVRPADDESPSVPDPVVYNDPPAGNEVNNFQELYNNPGSYYRLRHRGVTYAVKRINEENDVNGIGVFSTTVGVIILTSSSRGNTGLGILDSSLGTFLHRLLDDCIRSAVEHSGQPEDADREMSMTLTNVNLDDREVESNLFVDTPENRVAMINTLLDNLMQAANSSDSMTTFQELNVNVSIFFPGAEQNNLQGDGIPTNSLDIFDGNFDTHFLPIGMSKHKSKIFSRKQKSGLLMFVENKTYCWAVAIYLSLVYNIVRNEIKNIEFLLHECGSGGPSLGFKSSSRSDIRILLKELFNELELENEELEIRASKMFERKGLKMSSLTPNEDDFDEMSRALNVQIVILDETSAFRTTYMFPRARDAFGNVTFEGNTYDESKNTVYLLLCSYPVVDNKSWSSKQYNHYHALISPNAMLYGRLKRICLYCESVYHISWRGHRCSVKKKQYCGICHRPQAPILEPGQELDVETRKDYFFRGICMRSTVDNEEYRCPKCKIYCHGPKCLEKHKKSAKCRYFGMCDLCHQSFPCLGKLSVKKVPVIDPFTKQITGHEIKIPTRHIDCTFGYCRYCKKWETTKGPDMHVCKARRPCRATNFPTGLGSLDLQLLVLKGGRLECLSAASTFHAEQHGRKDFNYVVLTDLVTEFRSKPVNLIHRVKTHEGFAGVDYLEPENLRETLRYFPGDVKLEKLGELGLPTTWSECRDVFVDPQTVPEVSRSDESQFQSVLPEEEELWNLAFPQKNENQVSPQSPAGSTASTIAASDGNMEVESNTTAVSNQPPEDQFSLLPHYLISDVNEYISAKTTPVEISEIYAACQLKESSRPPNVSHSEVSRLERVDDLPAIGEFDCQTPESILRDNQDDYDDSLSDCSSRGSDLGSLGHSSEKTILMQTLEDLEGDIDGEQGNGSDEEDADDNGDPGSDEHEQDDDCTEDAAMPRSPSKSSTVSQLLQASLDNETLDSLGMISAAGFDDIKEEFNSHEEDEDPYEDIHFHTVGQRLIRFLNLSKFRNYTFVMQSNTGTEGAILLREFMRASIPVTCQMRGSLVSTLQLSNKARIVLLKAYLPGSLFSVAKSFGFAERHWTFHNVFENTEANLGKIWKKIPPKSWWRVHNFCDDPEVLMFDQWFDRHEGAFNFNEHLVDHMYNRSIVMAKVAMQFSEECIKMENLLLYDKRDHLVSGKWPVHIYGEEVFVKNNSPFAADCNSMPSYAMWIFSRFSKIELPILHTQRNDSPVAKSSQMELAVLAWYKERYEPHLQFAMTQGGQKLIVNFDGQRIYVDGYVPAEHNNDQYGYPKAKIYEIMGCYHHCCKTCADGGLVFPNLDKKTIEQSQRARIDILKQHGEVIQIWSHDVYEWLKDDRDFRVHYKEFVQNKVKSVGWREAHTTGVTEAYGVFASQEQIREAFKKTFGHSPPLLGEQLISQIDSNSSYASQLMKIDSPLHHDMTGQKHIPIPLGGMRTLFRNRIFPEGTCPKSCWSRKCANPDHGENDHESPYDCRVACEDHFNPDFFDVVSGIASVTLIAPRNLFYPRVGIPTTFKISKAKTRVSNVFGLCRSCAEDQTACKILTSTNHEDGLGFGEHVDDVHEHDPELCNSHLRFHTSNCSHEDIKQRQFPKVLPLNELKYILGVGYEVVRYHSVRFFAQNDYGAYDELMRRISREKIKAKGVPEGSTQEVNLFLQNLVQEDPWGFKSSEGSRESILKLFKPNKILGKLFKLVSCLIIGKLAVVTDRPFKKIISSHLEFQRLRNDENLEITSYQLLSKGNLLVSSTNREGAQRRVGRSGCVLFASMITAASRISMFKSMEKLLKEHYAVLYLGVDSLVVVPFKTQARPLEKFLPMHESLSGYLSYQHRNIKSVVIYGRQRYSIHNADTDLVEFKFSGLSGVRRAKQRDKLSEILHHNVAMVLLNEKYRVQVPQPLVSVGPRLNDIRLQDDALQVRTFHVFDIKRTFKSTSVIKGYDFMCTSDDVSPNVDEVVLYPLILSLPVGGVPVNGSWLGIVLNGTDFLCDFKRSIIMSGGVRHPELEEQSWYYKEKKRKPFERTRLLRKKKVKSNVPKVRNYWDVISSDDDDSDDM